jgi:hypothetical protein
MDIGCAQNGHGLITPKNTSEVYEHMTEKERKKERKRKNGE